MDDVQRQSLDRDSFPAVIDSTGKPDFSKQDERYWLKRLFVANDSGTWKDQIETGELQGDLAGDEDRWHVPASNLSEMVEHTHDLEEGTLVWCRPMLSAGNVLFYVFDVGVGGGVEFDARITGSTSHSANRWTYDWEEVSKATAGPGGWVHGDNQRSGSGAFNMIEDMNSATGLQGNGIDVSAEPFSSSNAELAPVATGVVERMHSVTIASDSSLEYQFPGYNGIQPKSGNDLCEA